MPRKARIYLPFASWPAEDQARWQAAFKAGDRFEGGGSGSHLAEATRRNLWISYARFLRFISANCPDLLELSETDWPLRCWPSFLCAAARS
jgi:hypothetical protein